MAPRAGGPEDALHHTLPAHLFGTRLALLLVLAATASAWGTAASGAQSADDQQEEERWGYHGKLPNWRFTEVYRDKGVADLRQFDTGQQQATVELIHRQLASFERSGDTADIARIFKQHGFEAIEKIAKAGQLDAPTSRKLAQARRQMIQQAMASTLHAVDPHGLLSVGMLDSGNKQSGISSDVDQTLFILPKDLARQLGISEADVIRRFNEHFATANDGVPPGRLGIESMNGADMFPDWRQQHTLAEFSAEADRVTREKVKNTEAYQSEGQLKSQVERRGYEELQKHHRRVTELSQAREAIENLRARTDLGDAERAARIAAVEAELLKHFSSDYPEANGMDDLMRRISRDSPWTEVRWDPLRQAADIDPLRDPNNRVLKDAPHLMERYAFDGAYDNHLMFERHPGNRGKYLLRSFSEGASLKRRRGSGEPVTPLEYEKLFAAGDQGRIRSYLAEIYPDASPAERNTYRKALDAAAMERLRHKGTRNPATGKDYTPQDIYRQYLTELTPAEHKLYQGMGEQALEKLRLEQARRRWEVDARGLMIENLVRTVTAPADILHGNVSDAELKRVQKKYPQASRAKLEAAARRQLRNGLLALMSVETAKYLSTPPEARRQLPRPKDLSMRLLERLGWDADSSEGRRLRNIAEEVANRRILTEPGQQRFRNAYYDYIAGRIRTRFNAAGEAYHAARQRYEDGVYTREYVAEKLVRAATERWEAARLGLADAFGFEVRTAIPLPDKGLPQVELEYAKTKWSARKLMSNMASAGNLDSVLQVALAYQEGGKEAAARAAAFEVVMNIPPLAKLNAVRDLLHGNPQGVVMMGSAMAVPVLGQAYMIISIGKTSVLLVGNYVVAELGSDAADKMYQGYLDESSGFSGVLRSQRVSLLHHVPIRVVTVPRRLKDREGRDVTRLEPVWQPYPASEAAQRFSVFPEEYDRLYREGVLGDVDDWRRRHAAVASEPDNPRGYFDAKRVSMYDYYRSRFGQRLDQLLKPRGLEIDDPAAFPLLMTFFRERIADWVDAKGEFAGFDENVIISRRFRDANGLRPEVVDPIARRAAGDLVSSYHIIRGIEENVQNAVFKAHEEQQRREANAMLVAMDEAQARQSDLPPAMAEEIHRVIAARRDEVAKVNEPRMHVRPRVVRVKDEQGRYHDKVELLVSITANPEAYPPLDPAKGYFHDIAWQVQERDNVARLSALVTAYTGADPARRVQLGATQRIEIGELKLPKPLPGEQALKVAMRTRPEQAEKSAPARAQTLYQDYDPAKASSWGDRWGDTPVSGLLGQLWVRWHDCPLGVHYYYEATVSGGEPRYQASSDGEIGPRFSYPDLEPGQSFANLTDPAREIPDFEAQDVRPNIFIVPFTWPQGYAGDFRVKGRILAFADPQPGDSWRRSKPLAVYPFEQPFTIRDEREASDIALMVKYQRKVVTAAPAAAEPAVAPSPPPPPAQPAPPAETRTAPPPQAQVGGVKIGRSTRGRTPARRQAPRPATVTRYEQVYAPFDTGKATPWELWGEEPAGGLTLQLWLNWREVPPNKRYYIEAQVSGGEPDYRYQYPRKYIRAVDSFPPYEGRPGPGTRFVLELPWPGQHAGRFGIKGRLLAVERGVLLPPTGPAREVIAEFPFRQTFSIAHFPRQASGTVKVLGGGSYMASAYGKGMGRIRIRFLQAGRRVARISADGKTVYALLNTSRYDHNARQGTLSFELPGTQGFDSATVTLRDFGDLVKLQVPMKITRRFTAPPFDGQCLERARNYRQPARDPTVQSMRLRQMAGCYAARATSDDAAYRSWQQYWLQARDVLRQREAGDGQPADLAFIYATLFEMAADRGDLAGARQWFGQLQAESRRHGRDAQSHHYKQLAEAVFRHSGDLRAARAAWQDYVAAERRRNPAQAARLKFPWEVHPGFELQ